MEDCLAFDCLFMFVFVLFPPMVSGVSAGYAVFVRFGVRARRVLHIICLSRLVIQSNCLQYLDTSFPVL